MRQQRGLLVVCALFLMFEIVAVTCASPEPTPTPTATPEDAGHEAEEGTDHATDDDATLSVAALRGRDLFNTAGCVTCHGQNAEGTDIAPGLSGHTEAQLRRQIQAPVGIMPVFPPDKITDSQMDDLMAYITGLEGGHAHQREGGDVGAEMEMHHWMALTAIEYGNVDEARHHVQHIIELTEAEHQPRMQNVLTELDAGNLHDAAHDIEQMLAGVLDDGLSGATMHLTLALSSARMGDAENTAEHISHFMGGGGGVDGADRETGQAILALVEAGKLTASEHELAELLQTAGVVVEEEGHAHDEGEAAHVEGEAAHTESDAMSPELVPLMEALEAIQQGDLEAAEREIEHFSESASGMDRMKAEEALSLLQAGQLHDAQDIIGELMGTEQHSH